MGFSRLLLAAATVISFSQADQAIGQSLIVGIGDYGSAAPKLEGVQHDLVSARKISTSLGIDERSAIVLRDGQATKASIMEAIANLAKSDNTDGQIFLYFSGHGTRYYDPRAKGCVEGLFTSEGNVILKSEFERALDPLRGKARRLIVMFDACHSGGVSLMRATRSLSGSITSKFHVKSDGPDQNLCKPVNDRTRSLFPNNKKPIELSENWVEITSARPDEVSFDQSESGGIATQSVRDCLAGQAKDLDGSGQISLAEVEVCSQELVRKRLEPFNLIPHHVTVRGARNLLPAPSAQQIALQNQKEEESRRQEAARLERERVERLRAEQRELEAQRKREEEARRVELARIEAERREAEKAKAEKARLEQLTQERLMLEQQAKLAALAAQQPPPPDTPYVAAMATLRDIHEQRRKQGEISVKLAKSSLRIGKDDLALTVKSPRDGWLYIVMLGSDQQSFYLLFPNALDEDNRIKKGVIRKLPAPAWRIRSAGPAGTNQLLVMVSDERRSLADLKASLLSPTSGSNDFLITPTDIAARSKLSAALLGEGLQKRGGFSSVWATVKEIE
jgi:hypothetical protein